MHTQSNSVQNPLGSSGKLLNHIVILLSRGTSADVDLTVATLVTPLRADGSHMFITYQRTGLSPGNSPPSAVAESLPPGHDQATREPFQNMVTGQDKPQHGSSQFTLDATIPAERLEAILAMSPSQVNFSDYVESAFQIARAMAQKNISVSKSERYFMRHCHRKVEKRLSYIEKIYLRNKHRLLWTPAPDEHVTKEIIDLSPIKSSELFKNIDHDGDSYRFNISNAVQWLECVLVTMKGFRIEMDELKEDDEASLSQVCRYTSILHNLIKLFPSSLWRIRSLVTLLNELRDDALSQGSPPIDDADDMFQKEDECSDMAEIFLDILDNGGDMLGSLPTGSSLFIRSLNAAAAWTAATRFLFKQRFLKSSMPIHCSLVELPNETPTNIKWNHYKSPSELWFSRGPLRNIKEQLSSQLNTIMEEGNNSGIHGGCPCESESGMMASMVASITEGSWNPMPAAVMTAFIPCGEEHRMYGTNPEEKDQLMDIGVTKRPCAICDLTAGAVNSWLKDQWHQLRFRLPGAHSSFYPWMPPTWLPGKVLSSIENTMMARLTEMVKIDDRMKEDQTTMSSSDSDERFENANARKNLPVWIEL